MIGSQSRRAILLGGIAALAMAKSHAPAHAMLEGDDLQQWLARNVVPLRTIDPGVEDFSDLEPLAEAIGDAQIVQLGEPSHGAGSSFAAKVRLIKFLHQRMGFDVVAWESGLYDLRQVQAAMRSGGDPVRAAQQGILRIWSASQECRPLFAYAQASLAGPRPLEMAGFDMQFTAAESADRFAADLRAFVRLSPALRQSGLRLAEDALAAFVRLNAYGTARARRFSELSQAGLADSARADAMAAWEGGEGVALRSNRSDLARLEQSVHQLRAVILPNRDTVDRAGGRYSASFMDRALDNLAGFGANLHDRYGVDRAAGGGASVGSENRRDSLNAKNLRWLIEEAHPRRKIVIWAHNAHIMNAYYGPDWSSISLEPRAGWMKPTGVFLAERFGQSVYTIGVTAYAGEDGFAAPIPATSVPPASGDSLEGILARLGPDYAFLDLRQARNTDGHHLRRPLLMRIPKYEEEIVADPTIPYDGILFIRQMARATRVEGA